MTLSQRLLIVAAFATTPLAATAADGTVLITGANRGIGLEYARQFADEGYRVIGTARNPASAGELANLGVRIEALDVADPASVASLAQRLQGESIDILVNNAGMFDRSDVTVDKVDFGMLEQTFAVNAFGPLRVIQALLPNLRQGDRKLIVNMSSQLGSIERSNGSWYGYRASKTALNQFNKILSVELGKEGFTSVVLHPGWVRTDIGGDNATLSTEESVEGLMEVIDDLTQRDNGRFYDFEGNEIPW